MAVEHYENFPVASWLCPAALRPPIRAIYAYARTADDLADEGNAPAEARVAALQAYRRDLQSVLAGQAPSPRWAAVYAPLADAIRDHALPGQPLDDLLSAFLQDAVPRRYADRAELLDYCRRSANPVGRLLLHLQGLDGDARLRAWSDAICTALQLANFWQDLGPDTARGRHYVPLADCARFGVDHTALARGVDTPSSRRLVADLVAWARGLMLEGAPLVRAVPGRMGWELRFVVQGGLRILERIDRAAHGALGHRPVIGRADAPLLAWRALTMGRALAAAAPRAA